MSRGTKIIILVIAGVVAIALIAYFVFVPLFWGGEIKQAINSNTNAGSGVMAPAGGVNTPAVTYAPEDISKNPPPPVEVSDQTKQAGTARTIAKDFAERLGTFSNQNDLLNIKDLETISTPAVYKYLSGEYRSGLLKNMPPAKDYYGATATAMSVNLAPSGTGEFSGKVQLQKVESGVVSQTSYAVLGLKLKASGDSWVVSWLQWEN